jgi:acyl-CoA thioesterase
MEDEAQTRREQFFQNDRFARYLEVELVEVSEGKAVARLQIQEHHLNSHNTAHGGVIFSLADAVFAAASNSRGTTAVAINVTISYTKAVTTGEILTAESKEISLNSTLAVYEIKVTNPKAELVAAFQGMVYLKKNRTENRPA